MMDKGLVLRDETQRSHVYRAAATEEETQRHLVSDLVERAFGGSASTLVMRALSGKTSADELERLRELLAGLEAREQETGALQVLLLRLAYRRRGARGWLH